jgi:FkbM family methyltransferase
MNAMKRFAYKVLNRLLYSGRYGDIALRRELISQLPKDLSGYVDVGAFDGSFFEIIRSERNIAESILVEPQDQYFNELKKKYASDISIKLIQSVLLSESKTVSFHVNTLAATSSVLSADEKLLGTEIDITGKTIETNSQTLDAVTASCKTIDLLKIDVQGAELEVLKGGKNALKKTQLAWIEVSFKPLYKGSALYADIIAFMESQGFVMMTIVPGFKGKSGELLQADCLFKKTGV